MTFVLRKLINLLANKNLFVMVLLYRIIGPVYLLAKILLGE